MISGSFDKSAKLWDLEKGTEIILENEAGQVINLSHRGRVVAAAFSKDKQIIVTGSFDRTAKLWFLGSNQKITKVLTLKGHDSYVQTVAISPDNQIVVTGSLDRTVKLWNLDKKLVKNMGWARHIYQCFYRF